MSDQTVTLRITSDARGLVAGVEVVKRELGGLGGAGETAGRRTAGGMQQVSRASEEARQAIDRARDSIRQVAGAAAAAFSVRAIVQYSDAYTNLTSKIRLVTSSESELAAVRSEVFGIAQRTRQEYEATAELYTRLARSTADLGLSQQQLLSITETINQAFVVSGATAQEASAAIIQLSQGLASGVLRGEEFNSVAEQAPVILDMLASSLGKTRGELRAMAEDGELTAEVLTTSLQQGAADVAAQFAQMDVTVGGALTQLRNSILETIGSSEAIASTMRGVVVVIQFVAENIGLLTGALALAATVMGARYVGAAVQAIAISRALAVEMGMASGAAAALNAAMARLALNPVALMVLGVGAAAYGAARVIQISIEQSESFQRTIEQIEALENRSIDIVVALAVDGEVGAQELEKHLEAVRAQATALWPEMDRLRNQAAELQSSWWKTADTWDRYNETQRQLHELQARSNGLIATAVRLARELAEQKEREAQTAAVAKVTAGLAEDIDKQVAAMERQRVSMGATAEAMAGYERSLALLEARKAKGTDLTEAETAAIVRLYDPLVAAARGLDQAKAAQDAKQQATKAATTADRDAKRAIEELANAQAEHVRTMMDLHGRTSEMAEAQMRYARTVADAIATADEQRRAKLDEIQIREQYIATLEAGRRALDDDTRAAAANAAERARASGAIEALLGEIDREIALTGVSEQERRRLVLVMQVEEAMRRAINEAMRASRELSEEEIAAYMRAATARGNALFEAEEYAAAARDSAAEYQRVWTGSIDRVATAFGDWIAGGIKSFRDFRKAITDIARQALADIIAMFVRNKIMVGTVVFRVEASRPEAGLHGLMEAAHEGC